MTMTAGPVDGATCSFPLGFILSTVQFTEDVEDDDEVVADSADGFVARLGSDTI